MQSLREYLDILEKAGQLVCVKDEVMPEPGIRQYLRAASNMDKTGPAVMFDNVCGYKGQRVLGATSASWANYSLMLGLDRNVSLMEQFQNIVERWQRLEEAEVKWVDNAPCQEVVVDKDINLYELLPLFRVNPNDGGFYMSKASFVTQDPDDPDSIDLENVGLYRFQIHGPDTIGVQIGPKSQGYTPLLKVEAQGGTMQCAILIGPPPFVSAMACAGIPYTQSEYRIAAALMGEPLELTKCIGSNLDVPAHTEIVIEGEIMPGRFCEGPFGEYPGSYSGIRAQRRVKVKRVTFRKNPIFENLYIGKSWTEHDTIVGLFTSVPVYMELIDRFPEVKAVNALYNHGLTVIVSTDQRFNGFAKTVALATATTTHGLEFAKNIIMVDGNVNPFDLNEVMWAMSFRLEHDSDIVVIPKMRGSFLDPSTNPRGVGSKLILDATTPKLPEPFGFGGVPSMTEQVPDVMAFEKRILALQDEQRR
jgi:UbiD family decarboxylase